VQQLSWKSRRFSWLGVGSGKVALSHPPTSGQRKPLGCQKSPLVISILFRKLNVSRILGELDMNTMKRRETFISYSRKDKDFALEFAREMKSAGYLVWLDQLDIATGARWDDEVEKALRECEIFLIILTTASVSFDNVKDEIGYAIDHRAFSKLNY
jgi:hypothetical protein